MTLKPRFQASHKLDKITKHDQYKIILEMLPLHEKALSPVLWKNNNQCELVRTHLEPAVDHLRPGEDHQQVK